MVRINIPQHSRGLTIAGRASGFALKAKIFQSDIVEARLLPAARHAYRATAAIGVQSPKKRRLFGPNVNRLYGVGGRG
jgi:hypothetical protein